MITFEIKWKNNGDWETVDTFDTKEEAKAMLYDYRLAFNDPTIKLVEVLS